MTNTELSGGDAVLRVAVLEQQVAALEAEKARQQSVPSGWVPLLIEYDPGYPEEVAFGPQRMMDRLKLWLDKYFAMLAAAPQADSSPLLAKLDISGIGRDAGHPRAVLLYLRHEPSDDDLRTIQEMFRTAYPAPAPAERVEQEAFWHAVVSDIAPVVNKAIRRLDVAEEYAEKCSENYRGVRVVPLYTTPQPSPAPSQQAEQVVGTVAAWRGINELGEVVTDWIDGEPPAAMFDLCDNPASYATIQRAYTASPAPTATDVAASDVAGLVEVSSKILAKLRHPTHSVNILDTEALERALGPFQRKEG